jgi:DNA-binding response OmpR family regulator
VTGVARGDEVLAAVKRHKPSILLLDVQLPGLDGYAVCRQIKTDPALSSVAVVFLTAAVFSDERMTGLLLGADDYVEKPVDLPDLALRVALVADRRAASPGDAPVLAAGELSYPDFVVRMTAALQQSGGALVLIRVPARMGTRVAAWLSGELRSDDLLGRYREEVRMLFLPGYLSQSAAHYVADLVSRLGRTGLVVHAGFGVAERPGERTLGALLQDADARLAASAAARPAQAASGDAVPEQEVRRTSVLIADDDPLVRSLAERPLVRAGFLCREAVDGQHALEQVHAECPDVLVLHLSMPRLDGLQVLEVLRRERHTDLRVIVISSSRQADDVKKAISLGARDYIVKPFNPLTLLTRVRQVLD